MSSIPPPFPMTSDLHYMTRCSHSPRQVTGGGGLYWFLHRMACVPLILDAKSRPDSLDYFVRRPADFHRDALGWFFQCLELAFQ